jgi:hypothetical protein
MVWDELARKGVKVSGLASLEQSTDRFRLEHAKASRSILSQGRSGRTRDLVQLYHLTLLKALLVRVDAELRLLEAAEQDPVLDGGDLPAASREEVKHLLHPPLLLRFRLVTRLMQLLQRIEQQGLRKTRKAAIGMSWPVSEQMLFNPLLALGGIERAPAFGLAYPEAFQDPACFLAVGHVLTDLLQTWLPEYIGYPPVRNLEQDFRNLQVRRDKGELPGYLEIERYLRDVLSPNEYKEGQICWLDEPDNLAWLLGGDSVLPGQEGLDGDQRWRQFRERLGLRLQRRLAQEGLAERLLFSVRLPEILEGLGLEAEAGTVLDHLARGGSGRDLDGLGLAAGSGVLAQLSGRIEQVRTELKAADGGRQRQWLRQALHGFACLRRDLKWAWDTFRALEDLNLLVSDADAKLSRSNRLLHAFGADADSLRREQRGHVILKADLRGSTEITASMQEKGLNPATHFSQNLFDPVQRLLRVYGANKVFVEGDAIILAFMEEESDAGLCVARACTMAIRMLELIRERNREAENLALPRLELGIGIAFADTPPTYLYDQGRPITISSAINTADRLSSCDAGLRHLLSGNGRSHSVESVLPDYCEDRQDRSKCLLRYNVNGILLQTPAFSKLRSEVVLTKLSSSVLDADGLPGEAFHVGRVTDPDGRDTWLVIREGRVRRWDGFSPEFGPPTNLVFYQVISDRALIKRLRAHLTAAGAQQEDGG